MKLIKTSLFFYLLLFFFSFAKAQKKIKIDAIASIVGENIILQSDILKYKKELESKTKDAKIFSDCEIMENIMIQKLLAHHAVVDSIAISNQEIDANVDNTLNYFKSQMGNIEEVVQLYGFDNAKDLKSELTKIERENLLVSKEKQSIVKDLQITPGEIRYFFNDLKKKGNLPNFGIQMELMQIIIKANPIEEDIQKVLEKLNNIKKEVENGYSFRLKAILYSQDPSVAQNGGKYTLTRESQFVKEFKEVAFTLEEGEISKPFKSNFGYHILQVEKIKGQEREVRHILLQPEIKEDKITAAKAKIESIRTDILAGNLSFHEAVNTYSQDSDTKLNDGNLINPYTNDSKFELNKMDSDLFNKIQNLKERDISEPLYEENMEGGVLYKIILVKKRIDAHEAILSKDYIKIQQLALEKKKQDILEKWYISKIKNTFIRINDDYKNCQFEYDW